MELPTAAAVIGGQPKRIDQPGESRKRELVEQDEPNTQSGS
ncbi:MAG TPA: hypothetical protein VNS34_22675 [Rhizobiaceae bacterium]|nr:hypothetical protein [Rhizobiaceae bacterium]